MGGERNIVCFGNRRNLFELHNTARVRNIGLNVIAGTTTEKLVIVKSRIKSLACRNGNGRFRAYCRECFEIVGRHGFFQKHRLELSHLLRDFDTRGNVKASVCLDQQIDLVAHRLANGGNTTKRLVEILVGDLQIILSKRIPLHRGDTALECFLGFRTKFLRLLRARKPTVDVNAAILVDLAAKQLIDGNVQGLSENIPQRHLHCRKRTHQHGTASPIGIAVNVVIMLFDLSGILAHKIAFKMLNGANERLFLVFERALSDARNSLVGIDLHKYPVGAEAIDHK